MPPLVIPQRLPTDDFVSPQGVESSTFRQPPLDGSLSFPMMVDWHAEHSPKHTWAVYPDLHGSLQHVTWRHLGLAMHNAALFIHKAIGKPGPNTRPVISVLANRDTLTYNCLMLGILRAGYTAFLISPRNSQAGVVHLLKTSKTVAIIGSSDHVEKKLLDGVRSEIDITVIEAPLFGDLFDLSVASTVEYQPLLPPLETPSDNGETVLIIHSSGSTAFPKPIPLSHIGALQWARIPCYGHHDFCGKRIGIQSAPPFHGMGFFHVLGVPIASGSHVACFRPQEPPVRPTPELVLEAWKSSGVQVGTGPPSNLVEWVKDPLAVRFLSTLEWLRVGGGPLPSPIGDALVSQGVRLLNGWGTTEVGVLSNPAPKEPYGKDWEYIQVTRNAKPIFEEREGGYHEICFPCTRTHYPSVFNDKEHWIYRTSDLVQLHPTIPGLFKVIGRTDDQIMLSTGEKTNPGPLENIIKGHALVRNAIYFGRGQFHNGVLVEPSTESGIDVHDDAALAKFRNAIWASVTQANDVAPTHSRIFKEMILVASPEKPFLLTPKGTVSRTRTLDLYADEIEAIYAMQKNSSVSSVEIPININAETLAEFITSVVTEVMRPDGGTIDTNMDLFLQGCDSLQATVLRNRLIAALRSLEKATNSIPSNLVYMNPTVPKLVDWFYKAFSSAHQNNSAVDNTAAAIEQLNRTVAEYRTFVKHVGYLPLPEKKTVILTGTTGSLGSYLLDELYKDSTVAKIYAINRSSNKNAVERQRDALIQRGIDPVMLLTGRVTVVDADLSLPDFAISADLFREMQDSATLIIHNAWRLDFNLTLTSFKPNMDGVLNLVNFALGSPFTKPPSIFFSSSLSVVSAHPTGWVEEAPADPAFVAPTGYGQSKYVAEKILEAAPVDTCSIRIGQLSGSTVNGAWNCTDWLPMLVKSYKTCGGLPKGNDDICWLPTDTASKIIIDFTRKENVPPVLHLVHPTPIKWSSFIYHMAKRLNVPVMPYKDWIEQLAAPESSDLVANPAVKVLPFLKAKPLTSGTYGREAIGIPRAQTELAEEVAPALADLPPLNTDDFDRSLLYWRREGFLPDVRDEIERRH